MGQIDNLLPLGLLVLSGISNLVIGVFIYLFAYKLSNHKYIAAKYFTYICLCIFNWALWIGLRTIYFYPLESTFGVYVSNLFIYLSIITIVQSLVFFAISFHNKQVSFHRYQFLIYPYILAIIFIITPRFGVVRFSLDNAIAYNSLAYYMLWVYIFCYMFLYRMILSDRHKSASTVNDKKNIQLILIGTIISLLSAAMTNVIVPFLYKDMSLVYYGPVSTLFLSFVVIMAMLRYKLFKIKLPIAGLLVTLIITVILLIIRFSIVDSRIADGLQSNLLIFFMFGGIYTFIIREVYVGAKNQILLDSKQKELQVALDSKNDFLKNSSHQFRTPLTVILGYLGMIIGKENPKYELNKTALADLEKTYISAKNLNEIINDVLSANDINTGRFGVNIKDTVNLSDLIKAILTEKKELLKDKSTKVKFNSSRSDLMILIDKYKVKEAFNNIIDNAIFYGKGEVSINIDTKQKDFIKVNVKDNGVGITRVDAKKIWKKFERGDKSALINPNGSGLGLYLAKQIMMKHGGDITAHSDGYNKGSVFTLIIPKNTLQYAPSDSFGAINMQ